jgi:hypothetical protein
VLLHAIVSQTGLFDYPDGQLLSWQASQAEILSGYTLKIWGGELAYDINTPEMYEVLYAVHRLVETCPSGKVSFQRSAVNQFLEGAMAKWREASAAGDAHEAGKHHLIHQ